MTNFCQRKKTTWYYQSYNLLYLRSSASTTFTYSKLTLWSLLHCRHLLSLTLLRGTLKLRMDYSFRFRMFTFHIFDISLSLIMKLAKTWPVNLFNQTAILRWRLRTESIVWLKRLIIALFPTTLCHKRLFLSILANIHLWYTYIFSTLLHVTQDRVRILTQHIFMWTSKVVSFYTTFDEDEDTTMDLALICLFHVITTHTPPALLRPETVLSYHFAR